jgi:hypothetical protein
MAALLVAYDLKKQGQNYTCITTKLEAYPTHWHMQGSVWIIQTNETPAQVRDKLKSCLDSNDNLFVALLTVTAWEGFDAAASKWLKTVIEAPAHS